MDIILSSHSILLLFVFKTYLMFKSLMINLI